MLFAGGLLGLLHETVISATADPTLVFAFIAMMGLPLALRGDAKRNGTA